ncbi:MAG: ATPase [Gemmatimonadales bacterium]|nr:MAG: ATPase [Gemmatimonadales bacterium]
MGLTEHSPAESLATRFTEWRGWKPWVVSFAAWTVLGLFTWQQRYFAVVLRGHDIPWIEPLPTALASAWLWALFTPAILRIAARYPLGEEGWVRTSLPVHLLAAACLAACDAVADHLLGPWVEPYPAQPVRSRFLRELFVNAFSYGAVVGVAHGLRFYTLYRERQAEAERLHAQLAEANLESLKAQLQPHFLFNTLNAAAELVHQDAEAAERMIARLGTLLRRSVETWREHEVELRTELDAVAAYLDIVSVRFPERVELKMRVDPEALDALVPPFVLQPIVENAVRHGIGPLRAGGLVEIACTVEGGRLTVSVRDDGQGAPPEPLSEGVGLSNTRRRLQTMYGDNCEFKVSAHPEGGTQVTLSLPFRSAKAVSPIAR